VVPAIHLFAKNSLRLRKPNRAYQTKVPTDSEGNMVWKNVS
jgi:hypothetical protein